MHYRSMKAKLAAKAFVGFLLIVQLIGCGSASNSTASGNTSVGATLSPATTPFASGPPPFATNSEGAFTVAGLLHFQTGNPIGHSAINCLSLPVLTTDRLTYDSGEIQQMANYFDDFSGRAPLPNTLENVIGDFNANIPNWNLPDLGCTAVLEITNVGQSPVQITQIALKLTEDAWPNNYHYRLIDICSLPITGPCFQARGGNPSDLEYNYGLQPAKKNTVFLPLHGPTSLILNPASTTEVDLLVNPEKVPGDSTYSLMPELTLNTAKKSGMVIDLPQWTSTVSFVNPQTQYTCYQLQGSTFKPLSPPVISQDLSLSNETVTCE